MRVGGFVAERGMSGSEMVWSDAGDGRILGHVNGRGGKRF